jgi:hypothetical protein
MPDVILHDKELSNSAYSHVINAPLANIDIAEWLLSVKDLQRRLRFCCITPAALCLHYFRRSREVVNEQRTSRTEEL